MFVLVTLQTLGSNRCVSPTVAAVFRLHTSLLELGNCSKWTRLCRSLRARMLCGLGTPEGGTASAWTGGEGDNLTSGDRDSFAISGIRASL